MEKYLHLAGIQENKLRKVETPFSCETSKEHENGDQNSSAMGEAPDNEIGSRGKLHDIAARVLMKVLYAARMARPDLLRATNFLATKVTKWDTVCDKALHRLISYIHHSLELKLTNWVGDELHDLSVELFSDADFAGDRSTMRSTSGVHMNVMGKNTSCVMASCSKKQTAVSHSTPEAELVAADHAIRTEGIPALILWNTLLILGGHPSMESTKRGQPNRDSP